MSLSYFSHPPHNIDKRLSLIPEAALTSLDVRMWSLRLSRRLTQKELAIRAGISRETVQATESGRTWPTLIVALKIAKALDTPVEKLFILRK